METNRFLSPRSTAPIYLGIALVVAGVGLIALTWFKIAELVLVPAQFPLLVSGGLTGVVLVLVGLTLVNVHITRMESARRVTAINKLAESIVRAGLSTGRTEASGPDDHDATGELPTPAEIIRDAEWESPDSRSDSRSVWE